MQRHVQDRHDAHIGEPDNEEHKEGNRRVVLIHESVEDDEAEVCAETQFDDRHHARSPQILLRDPAIGFAFDFVFRRSLEAALDPQQRLHDTFRIAH